MTLERRDLRDVVRDFGEQYSGVGFVYGGEVHFDTKSPSPAAHFCNHCRSRALARECRDFYRDAPIGSQVTRTCPAGFRIAYCSFAELFGTEAGVVVHQQCGGSTDASEALEPAWSASGRKERKKMRQAFKAIGPWKNPGGEQKTEEVFALANEALRNKADAAEEEALARLLFDYKDFVASFSHEVLGPLQEIRSAMEAARLKAAKLKQPALERELGSAGSAVHRVRVGVEGMRLLFNPEGEITANRRRKVDLLPIAEVWVGIYERQIEAKNIRVIVDPDNRPWTVDAVPEYMDVLVRNLISNAVKYSFDASTYDEPGKLLLRYQRGALEVTSYGVPIPQEEIRSGALFELSRRGATSSDRGRQGKGVGLHLVKTIVSQHGWDIGVTSTVQNPDSLPHSQFAKTTFRVSFGQPKSFGRKKQSNRRRRR